MCVIKKWLAEGLGGEGVGPYLPFFSISFV